MTIGMGEAYSAVASSPDKILIHKGRKEADWKRLDEALQAEVESLWRNST